MTPEQQKAVEELRQVMLFIPNYKERAESVITLLTQTQSALEQAQRDRDEAQSAIAWVAKLLDRITRFEALNDVVEEARTWLLSPVLLEASKRFVPVQERNELQAKLDKGEGAKLGLHFSVRELQAKCAKLEAALKSISISSAELHTIAGKEFVSLHAFMKLVGEANEALKETK